MDHVVGIDNGAGDSLIVEQVDNSDPAKQKSGAISPGFSSMRSPKSRVHSRLIRPVKIPSAVAVDIRSAFTILGNLNGMMPAEDVTPCALMSTSSAFSRRWSNGQASEQDQFASASIHSLKSKRITPSKREVV